jgi:hypothetical protein
MTENCKKSEKSIDNLLFSSEDESVIFTDDFKAKNIVNNNQSIDHDDLTS